jgi:hypothetical protein
MAVASAQASFKKLPRRDSADRGVMTRVFELPVVPMIMRTVTRRETSAAFSSGESRDQAGT